MKKIKIFLALSKDLKDENLEIADLIEHLNLILEPQDIHIYLEKWNYLVPSDSSAVGEEEKGKSYEKALDNCEICMVVFGKEFGEYTQDKLKKAYDRVCRDGENPSKLYVYFKNEEELAEDLRKFRDSFPEAYGHFTGKFSDTNTLKNDFLLQFQLYQSQNLHNSCPVEIKDSKVTVFGKDLFIDLMKIPFLGNNETYNDLLDDITDLKDWLEEHEPDHKKYAEKAEKLRDKIEKRDKMEQSIWNTAIEIARLSNQRCSERLKKAIDLFNAGDNKGADAILNTEDILKDAEHNLQMKRLHEEGLRINIEELKLKSKTLENEMAEGWVENILKLQDKIVEYTGEVFGEKSEALIRSLLDTGFINRNFGQYKHALELQEKALKLFVESGINNDALKADILSNISWNYIRLENYPPALEAGERAFEIRLALYGEDHEETANSINNLGAVYNRLKDHLRARDYFQRALDIRLKILGEENPITISSFTNMGIVSRRLEEYDKALEWYNKVLEYRLKNLGEQNPKTIDIYNNIGIVYRKTGKIEEALKLYHKVLDFRLKNFGENHPDTLESYFNLSVAYSKSGDEEKAQEYRTKSKR